MKKYQYKRVPGAAAERMHKRTYSASREYKKYVPSESTAGQEKTCNQTVCSEEQPAVENSLHTEAADLQEYAAPSEPQKIQRKRRKWPFILLAAVLLICGCGFGLYNHYYNLLGRNVGQGTGEYEEEEEEFHEESPEELKARLEKDLEDNLKKREETADLDDDLINILLVGVDSRNESLEGRSDAMIIFTINTKTKRIVMTSLLRDSYVYIPGYYNTRLNAAYSFGGSELLYETISANIGIDVDKCVVVNFLFVADMVDALGGIDIEMSADEVAVMNKYIRDMNSETFHVDSETDVVEETDEETRVLHVNGKQALGYARNRYTGTDFARTYRQRNVINLCLDKIKKMSITEINNLAETLLPKLGTDLSRGDIAKLLLIMMDVKNYDIEQMTIPETGTWYDLVVNGAMVLGVDYEANYNIWYNYINEVTETEEVKEPPECSGTLVP